MAKIRWKLPRLAQFTQFIRRTGSKSRRSLWSKLLLGALGVAVFGMVVVLGAWLRACAVPGACPSIAGLTSYDPMQASKVYAADGRQITDFGLERRTVLSLEQMAPSVPAAFLAVEDKRFYDHDGVDWLRSLGAIKAKLTNPGSRLQGFSTITMQLAGNMWPDEIDRSERRGLRGIMRKIREIKVAQQIEARYDKKTILELYLNKIHLGNNAYGVEAAARRYFGKRASELNTAEAAMLAALPKAPSAYNPRNNPGPALQRRNVVLELMVRSGKLSREAGESWKGYPLALSSRSDFSAVGEYFVEYVRQQMTARFGEELYRNGYQIYTTIDLDVQAAAERALAAQLERIEAEPGFRHTTYREYHEAGGDVGERTATPYLQGAVIVMEARTGNILAMVGGRDFNDSKFNRAVQALRQPGSTFKPIVYAAALEAGRSLNDIEVDEAVSIAIPDQPNWEPANYDSRFSNLPMTIREALLKSTNTVAVKVGMATGIDAVAEMGRRFGIASPLPRVPSLMLGSATVRPIEMAAAYTVFANLGVRAEPNAISRVEGRNGSVLESHPERRRVLDEATAWLLTDALRGVVTGGTATTAVWNAGFRIPSGGKTGTTNDYRDVWYIGFTNDLVGVVWIGLDDNTRIMGNAQGGRLAAPAWTAMMQEIYQRRRTPAGWPQPADMRRPIEIDAITGFKATPFCPPESRVIRHFAPGEEPREFCPIHGSPYGQIGNP